MTEKTVKTIRGIYGAVFSASAVVAGICLMAAAWGIYRSGGEQIYTPEKVAAAFGQICVPVYLFLVLAAGSILLEAVLPHRPKAKNAQQPEMLWQRLTAKADMTYCGPQLSAAITKQRKCRAVVTGIGAGILALCTAVFLVYALNGSNFHQTDITGSVIRAMYVMLPCLAIPFAYAVFAAYFCKKSILAECDLLKTVPKAADRPAPAKKAGWETWLKWGLLAAAAVLLVVGLFTGGTVDVLTKAANICTECVGLG